MLKHDLAGHTTDPDTLLHDVLRLNHRLVRAVLYPGAAPLSLERSCPRRRVRGRGQETRCCPQCRHVVPSGLGALLLPRSLAPSLPCALCLCRCIRRWTHASSSDSSRHTHHAVIGHLTVSVEVVELGLNNANAVVDYHIGVCVHFITDTHATICPARLPGDCGDSLRLQYGLYL